MKIPNSIWNAPVRRLHRSADEAQSLLGLTREALADLVKEAGRHGVDLAWTIDPDLPAYVHVNRIDLFAIISVLVRRALQLVNHAPLHLGVQRYASDQVELRLEDAGDTTARLSPAEWQQLGYWVEELGGVLTTEAEGLHWRVLLPLDPMPASQVRLDWSSGLRVMVACADTDTRRRILELLGNDHSLVECNNARDTVLMVRRRRFDLLLLDWDLPDACGPELAGELRTLTPVRQLFAIMMAGEPKPPPSLEWITCWLHKPPRTSEFNALIEHAALAPRLLRSRYGAPEVALGAG